VQIAAVSPGDLSEDAYLIDVREPGEWDAGHAPRAHHLPMMELPGRVEEVPSDREVVIACRVGQRSAQVVTYLMARGFDNVVNLDGGMQAWAAEGLPLVSEDGFAARID
jgi:rhodanese-related sulfurtransferase